MNIYPNSYEASKDYRQCQEFRQIRLTKTMKLQQAEAYSILIIDDDYGTRELLKHIFKHAQINVITADSGLVGLELARKLRPSLILMDSHMPNMSGFEAITRIKNDEMLEDIPVIVMTAGLLNDTNDKVVQTGTDGCIQKPFNRRELLDYVQPYLN